MAARRIGKVVKSPGGHPPVYTGKGTHGTGLGYHGKPRGATTPAKGMGYHGKPPKFITGGLRKTKMVHPIAKPAAHKAGTRRAPGH
jgi:hypothetical protein